jgi:hypothetical protein
VTPTLFKTFTDDTRKRFVDALLAREYQVGTHEQEIVEVGQGLLQIEATIHTVEHTRCDRVRLTLRLVEEVRSVF